MKLRGGEQASTLWAPFLQNQVQTPPSGIPAGDNLTTLAFQLVPLAPTLQRTRENVTGLGFELTSVWLQGGAEQ